MTKFNINNKIFSLVENSENGEVNSETLFRYKQEKTLITADYNGGTIKYGKIIGYLEKDEINMLYQCLTVDNELKAGKAVAKISLDKNNKIKLKLNWVWLNDKSGKGTSEYIEN
ncbi:hypothetical protein [Seonamhaeicola maritimus]|uniref:N-acetylglutamate synthase n=1 Tax=Seonamhaeicola maritimus TaxID=2591822 RepID=A0A5C7GH22_9FLAO|nr:hypothetical protein [Seonamhaeicola maritimus]TXG36555.1 hypothetical protein FUA22_08160 [Seonamhaeicola maritimus]